jgi:hypothetical protein
VKLLQLRRDVIHSPGAIYEAGSSILNKFQLLVLDVLAGRNKRVAIVKMRQHKSCHQMSRCFGIQILVDFEMMGKCFKPGNSGSLHGVFYLYKQTYKRE